MYHAVEVVDEDPHALCVPPERFEAQMAWLARRGWRGMSVRELLEMDAGAGARAVGLTFDDGYASFGSTVVPVLQRAGFTATVYISSAHVGGHNTWDAAPRLGLMGADELVDVHSRGMEVGSHAVHHHPLTTLGADERLRELSDSLQALSDILGWRVQGLSYPYGDADRDLARQARSAGYTYAVAAKQGDRGDRWLLPRRYVGAADNGLRLTAKLALSP
jgi:peptidoglycan/xylan/chitin deacetylase (PgdA/CDA1 family)